MVLENRIKNHLKIWNFHFSGSMIMLNVLWFLKFKPDAIMIFSIWWLIITIPSIYFHVEYYFINRNTSLQIGSNEIAYKKGSEHIVFDVSQIESITIYATPNKTIGSKGIQYMPFESFFFGRIILKSGEKMDITNLLSIDLHGDLSKIGFPIRKKKRVFPTTLI